MIIGVSATSRGLTARQSATIWCLFDEFRISVLHFGDCVGGDAQLFRIAQQMGAWTVAHPPSNPKARAFCKADQTMDPVPYLKRNWHIVYACDGFIGAPKDFHQPKNLRGQGTWTTIGYARKRQKEMNGIPRIWLVMPDGTFREEKFNAGDAGNASHRD